MIVLEGFYLQFLTNFTKNDMMTLCHYLNQELNKEENKYKCEPEPISEGGIIYHYLHDKNLYKSFRWHICRHGKHRGKYLFNAKGNWPMVNNINDWIDNNQIIFYENDFGWTFFKSYETSEWATNEINILMDVLTKFNIKIFKLPKNIKNLK